jgi:Zn finger protein HypA/HybF involved in hydrogenase expression
MHDRAVVADLMKKLTELAGEHLPARVVGTRVIVGALSHVDPVHLAESLEEAAVGTPIEGISFEVLRADDEHDARGQDVVLDAVMVED